MTPGFVVAAPASGSGKTVITLGLLRAFATAGAKVASLKIGPDFIDPAFHAAASGDQGGNLDLWAMREETCVAQIASTSPADILVAEGVMGLFDGAGDETGSTAEAAARYGWPVVLVIDVQGQAASAAAVAEGFINHRPDVDVVGVIANRVASDRHRDFVAKALEKAGITCFGYVFRSPALDLPSRHLGLIQAGEQEDIDAWLDQAAGVIEQAVDLKALRGIARPTDVIGSSVGHSILPPLGKHISVARDPAFAFFYPHIADDWSANGTTLDYFSPLADEAPAAAADAIYLPGGYPELHAATLAANQNFLRGLRGAADRGVTIYGECGGYMSLGERLIDADGNAHEMAGLLPIQTSFAERRLNLGYRQVELVADGVLGAAGQKFRGHEFHYSTHVDGDRGDSLFRVWNAAGEEMPPAGCRVGSVIGSYMHLVDRT